MIYETFVITIFQYKEVVSSPIYLDEGDEFNVVGKSTVAFAEIASVDLESSL